MPLNKRTKLSLKTRKRKSDKTESDLDEEKLIIVDMPDNSDRTLLPTTNNSASTINFTATAANRSTQVMSKNLQPITLLAGIWKVTMRTKRWCPTRQLKSRRRRNLFPKTSLTSKVHTFYLFGISIF